jgi:hypothetical protein
VIAATFALTTAALFMTQHVLGAGNSSSVGKDNPQQVPLSSHPPCPNQAKSTAGNSTNSTTGNSTNIVKSDLLFTGNNIVKIASNNPKLEPIVSYHKCQIIGYGSVTSQPTQ